jgi:hypothetical protein
VPWEPCCFKPTMVRLTALLLPMCHSPCHSQPQGQGGGSSHGAAERLQGRGAAAVVPAAAAGGHHAAGCSQGPAGPGSAAGAAGRSAGAAGTLAWPALQARPAAAALRGSDHPEALAWLRPAAEVGTLLLPAALTCLRIRQQEVRRSA